MKRTLLIVAPYFPPQGGGLERYALSLATELRQHHDWRIVVIASGEQGSAVTQETIDGLTIYRLGYTAKLSNAPLGWRWLSQIRHIIRAEKPELVNVHAPVPGIADLTALVSGRIPLVVTWHAGSMIKGGHWTDPILWLYENIAMRGLMNRAKRIICTSNFVRNGFLKRYAHKSLTVHPGTDLQRFTPSTPPTTPSILFAAGGLGRGDTHKGLHYLLDALPAVRQAVPNVTLRIIGEGELQADYQAQADRLGVGDMIMFVGRRYGQELVQEYQSAQVYISPTTNDSFGMTIAEAIACGRPVIASAIGDIPELIEHDRTGLLTAPGDVQAISAGLIRLLQDPKLANAMGKLGRQRLKAGFSWTHQANLTNQLFGSLIETNSLPRIVEVVSYYPPHVGGMENVVQELSNVLANQGQDVQVLTSRLGSAGTTTHDQENGPVIKRLQSLEVLNTPIMIGLFWNLITQPRRSVVHLHIAQALAPEITLVAAKLRGFKLISHIHLDVDPSSRLGEMIFRPYKRIFLGRVLRHSDRVIVFSTEQKELMVNKYDLDPSRVIIIPNGVAPRFFHPAKTSVHQPLRLLYVGRLAVQKRPERLIEAMRENPSVHLDVLGDGPDRAALEAYVRQHQLTNVVFHGFRQGAELEQFYHQADALVMTSDREGMPLVALEAMAAGVPVIGSNVIGIREIVGGVGRLVDNPSAASFSRAIANLAAKPDQLLELSRTSRQAATNYSWDKLAQRITTLFREVQS